MNSETVRAYAKINLWLDITGRRADGYHLLNTIMRRVELYDEITVTLTGSEGITLECDTPGIPCGEINSAYRACTLFGQLCGKQPGVHIDIKKGIPLEAGLGGSSTDGAAVLEALNRLCGSPFSFGTLAAQSVKLGADTAFCLYGGTAVCRGIGERVQPVECADFFTVIIKPEFSFSTSDAYKAYDSAPLPVKPGFEGYCAGIRESAKGCAAGLYNIFETLYRDERIEKIKNDLITAGALGSSMTGSGSAVYGIFESASEAENAVSALESKYRNIYCVRAL